MDYQEQHYLEIPQQEIMREAREDLSGYWGMGAVIMIIVGLITTITGIIPLVSLVIAGPFALGVAIWSQNVSRDRHAEIGNVFDGFQNLGTSLAAYLLMTIAIMLGTVLFIIPGIIVAIGLSQTMFNIADDPKIGPVDALQDSWEMMNGYKWDYFVLCLRFLPWILLSILTLFIGMLWLVPWMNVTLAKFHDYLVYGEVGFDDEDVLDHLID